LADEVCLVLLSTSPDSFFALSQCKERIAATLTSTGALRAVEASLGRADFSVAETSVPPLLHFIYKSSATSQVCFPLIGAPYSRDHDKQRLLRLYQSVHATLTGGHGVRVEESLALAGGEDDRDALASLEDQHKIFFAASQSEAVIAWATSSFELYAVFDPLEAKTVVIKSCNQLLRWIKKEEQSLFIHSSPTW
jgi:hypothetical protein